MHNMVHPQESQHPIVEISSPLGARLEFSESELFPDALQNSEAASISSNNNNNCCYEEHSSYNNNNNNNNNKNNISNFTMDDNNYNNTTTTTLLDHHDTATTTPTTGKDNHPLFDDHLDNNDISASIDFTPSSPSFSLPQHHQYFNNNNNNNNNNNDDHNHNHNNNNQEILFSMSSMYNNIQISSSGGGETYQYNIPERPLIPTAYNNNNNAEESGFMSSVSLPSYYNTSIDPMINIGNYLPFSFDVFAAGNGLFLGNDVSAHHHHQDLELQGDNISGIFHPDSAMARVFNYSTADLQVVSSEGQHQLLHGSPGATLASEISSLEDPNFKVAKLSVEERKRKIHRYLKKRNERNFSKKIKYACRKTLADSRPRVRGRFAKNDELAEINIARTGTGTGTGTGHNHEDDREEDGGCLFSNPTPHLQHNKGLGAEEELEASDIFAHISGVNSFKCNYPIQSWI